MRQRRGKWVLDYRDGGGRRRWRDFPLTPNGKRDAEIELGRVQARARGGGGEPDTEMTLERYVKEWLAVKRVTVRARTLEAYEDIAVNVLGKEWGIWRLVRIDHRGLKTWAARLLDDYAPGTVRHIVTVTHHVFEAAHLDGLIPTNPARGVLRALKLLAGQAEEEKSKAPQPGEVAAFMAKAAEIAPRAHVAFTLMAFAGLRFGEALGLRHSDIEGDVMHVRQQLDRAHKPMKLKTKHSYRTVPVAKAVKEAIRVDRAQERAAALRRGREPCELVVRQKRNVVGREMKRVLKAAKLPIRYSPHGLRHYFGTQLVEKGANLKAVQHLMGHASIRITADLYAKKARPAVGVSLDDIVPAAPSPERAKVVSITRTGTGRDDPPG